MVYTFHKQRKNLLDLNGWNGDSITDSVDFTYISEQFTKPL